MTGFHKRKVARTEAAREKALERQKQERREARNEVRLQFFPLRIKFTHFQQRRALRERATENAAQVEEAYGGILSMLLYIRPIHVS